MLEERARLEEGLSGRADVLRVAFHSGEQSDPFGEQLAAVADELVAMGGEAVVRELGHEDDAPGRPALSLVGAGGRTVHYLAMPEGPEERPFYEALLGLAAIGPPVADVWAPSLAELSRPARLVVFIASACPHCPQAVRAALRLTRASADVTTLVVDAQRFPELAERYGVRSVPTTVIDSCLALTGVLPAAELAERLVARDTDAYEEGVFQSMVETGRVGEAVHRLHGARGVAQFVAIWRRSATATRIGLMMAAEEVLEEDAAALDGAVPALLPVLATEDAALRGDTADLLGQIGHPSAAPGLRPLLADANPDVAEIAQEALDALRTEAP